MFPLTKYSQMRDDIGANGVRFPVMVGGGWFVDGRTRLRACAELDLDPPVRELSPNTDLTHWIISANVHRRHLKHVVAGGACGPTRAVRRGHP